MRSLRRRRSAGISARRGPSAVAAIASTVILLLSGPTAMNASIVWSRAISPILSVANWLIVTLSGLMPDSFRTSRSSVTLACVRPITPTRWPASSSRLLILGVGCFFEPLAGRPEGAHSTTTFLRRMATDSAFAGRFRSPRATARSALPAVNNAMLSAVPSVVTSDSRTALFSRANVCAINWISFWSSLPAGPTAIRSVVGRST